MASWTWEEIDIIMREKKLCAQGFSYTKYGRDRVAIEFVNDQPSDIVGFCGMVNFAAARLACIKTARSARSACYSYGLKHWVERSWTAYDKRDFAGCPVNPHMGCAYVSNGAVIAAAAMLGLRIEQERVMGYESPKGTIFVSKADALKVLKVRDRRI